MRLLLNFAQLSPWVKGFLSSQVGYLFKVEHRLKDITLRAGLQDADQGNFWEVKHKKSVFSFRKRLIVKGFFSRGKRCILLLFFAGIRSVGNGNLVPSEWDYLGEKKISTHADVMFIPCNFFDDVYWKFCFHYVTRTVLGETQTMTKMCLSAKEPSKYQARDERPGLRHTSLLSSFQHFGLAFLIWTGLDPRES